VYVYENSSSIVDAVLYSQQWTGGLAFTNQNIILIAISSASMEVQAPGLSHELAHLLVAQESHSCFGDLPTWLSEGMAKYAEGSVTTEDQALIDAANNDGTLVSIRSLSSSFPASHGGASLSYAQSASIVTYLIEAHGWEKMQELMAVFKFGSSYDGALETVYGFDQIALDAFWREWLSS
jgi:hypothetical protein